MVVSRFRARAARFCLFALLSFVLASCATAGAISARERATRAIAIGHSGLVSVQDAARALCQPPVDRPWSCSSPVAAAAGLTDARYQAINAALVRGFETEIKIATAVRAWRAGDPAPADLPGYFAVVADVLAMARQLDPARAAPLIRRAVELSTAAEELRVLGVPQ